MKIILASASPRRRDLLSVLGHDVLVVAKNGTELDEKSGHNPDQMALINAHNKARAVFDEMVIKHHDIIIGADTVVVSQCSELLKTLNKLTTVTEPQRKALESLASAITTKLQAQKKAA